MNITLSKQVGGNIIDSLLLLKDKEMYGANGKLKTPGLTVVIKYCCLDQFPHSLQI